MTLTNQPVGKIEPMPMDWSHFLHHAIGFRQDTKLREVYQEMLTRRIDFAVELDDEHKPSGLVSFKMLAAAMSGEYGQALMSKKKLSEARTLKRRVKVGESKEEPTVLAVVIPLAESTIFPPNLKFLEAQNRIENRSPDHTFDDIIVVDAAGRYLGLIGMRDFVRLQINRLRWQEEELSQRNRDLHETVTQLSFAQTELVNRAKMASLGELVAGIAHEMNTPLGVLLSAHEVIEKIFPQFDFLPDVGRNTYLKQMMQINLQLGREAGERVSQIIQSLRTFGHKDLDGEQKIDLVELVQSNLTLMAAAFKPAIKVHTEFPEKLHIRCFPGQLSQVVLNLLTNAVQAMAGPGEIWVKLEAHEHGAMLTVRDSGPGIAHELLERIFDPGFTTKGVGVGTGLGLSICRKIVELNHHGKIRASNHEHGGATFTVTLP